MWGADDNMLYRLAKRRLLRQGQTVVVDRIGRAHVRYRAGFKKRNHPRQMLTGNRNGALHGKRDWTPHANRLIEDRVNPPQIRATEHAKAVRKEIMERDAFVHALHSHLPPLGGLRIGRICGSGTGVPVSRHCSFDHSSGGAAAARRMIDC